MEPFEPCCRASGIGSLPHKSAEEAVKLVLENYNRIPFWPQLPKRSPLENMYTQFAEGLPGLTDNNGKLVIDTTGDYELKVAEFFERYLAAGDAGFPLDPSRAQGLFRFVEDAAHVKPMPGLSRFFAVKGQVTGPISFGLTVQDQDMRPILYNDLAMDAIAKNIAMLARWQEDLLQSLEAPTIMFYDEPSMATFGSAYFNYSADLVSHYMEIATEGLRSMVGIHCCGNTDWSMLLEGHISLLSFDAYAYADKILLYADDLAQFLQRGGALGVGIVPAQWEFAGKETVESLYVRLEAFYAALEKRGIDPTLAARRTLITPSCGLGPQDELAAESIVRMTTRLSQVARERLGLVGKEIM